MAAEEVAGDVPSADVPADASQQRMRMAKSLPKEARPPADFAYTRWCDSVKSSGCSRIQVHWTGNGSFYVDKIDKPSMLMEGHKPNHQGALQIGRSDEVLFMWEYAKAIAGWNESNE